MYIKFLRKLIPLKIYLFIKSIIYKDSNKTFVGKFKNYQLTLSESVTDNGYLNDKLDKLIYQKISDYKKVIVNKSQAINIILKTILINNVKKNNILEIGGGHNPIFIYSKKTLDKKIFKNNIFYVLERKNVCELIRHNEKNLKYIYNLKKLKKINMCFFSTSAQYVQDFEELIKQIVKLKPNYISLTNFFSSKLKNDFYTIQTNMPPSKFPVKIFSIKKLINLFNIYNYKVLYLDEQYANYDYKLEFINKIFKTDLVLIKK
jgi:putative methyltransferase (TIGR04325 family)